MLSCKSFPNHDGSWIDLAGRDRIGVLNLLQRVGKVLPWNGGFPVNMQ